jgi:signal peptide peptidase SppA
MMGAAALYELFDGPIAAISARGLEQLCARLESPTPVAAGSYDGGARQRQTTIAGIPVLAVYGVLGHRPSGLLELVGGASYIELAQSLRQAVKTKPPAILLDIDSPGGSVRGLEELAQEVYAARRSTRIVAAANACAASAAYCIAAQADAIFVTPSGEVGSIGAIATHADLSGAYEKEGIRVRVFRSANAPRKSLGHPAEKLTEAGAVAIQREVDRYAAVLVRDVARGRGVSSALVARAYGQGAMFGSGESVQNGLADVVGTLQDAFNWCVSGSGEQQAGVAAARERRADQDLAAIEGQFLRAGVRALQRESLDELKRQLRELST